VLVVDARGEASFMGFWTNKEHRTAFDDANDLAYAPSGGPIKAWLLGVGLALFPLGYGVKCLLAGQARFFGRRGSHIDLDGSAATALAIAYIAVGVFIHAHWFWGYYPKLEPWSYILKFLAVMAFLGGFGYAVYKVVA
jgi:hypothetical protein